jgi:ribose-phosphate pyrophosphokinase
MSKQFININTGENIEKVMFPDNQPHVNIKNIKDGDEVNVVCALTDANAVLQLLQLSNALQHAFAKKKTLVIPYLMAARYDRLMVTGDSVDLQVIAQLINSCQFEKVILFDAHSDVSSMLINNSINITNEAMVKAYQQENAVLICPDAGAAKKISKYFEWNKNLTDIVYCNKSRDLATGKLTLQVLEPEKCIDRNCVIIDDICDGGGTFLAIADQIKPKHLSLVVSHGIFSKGFDKLQEKFHEIIVSNSMFKKYDAAFITTKKIDYASL